MRYLFSIAIIVLITSNCYRREYYDIKTLPSSFKESDFALDTIAEDLLLIPLNFESAIGQIKEIKWHEPYLYICTTDGSVKGRLSMFNFDGKLVKSLDRVGRGPGEYLSIQQIFIDRNESIYINTWHKIVVYDKYLNHLRDIKWPKGMNFAEMYMYKDHIFLFQKAVGSLPKYDWVVFDTTGNILSSKLFDCYHSIAYPPPASMIIFENNDILYRYRSISDTIYKIDEDGFNAEFIIDRKFKDGYRMYSQEEISRKVRWDVLLNELHNVKLRFIDGIYGIGNQWIISYVTYFQKNINYEAALFNQSSNIGSLMYRQEVDKSQPNYKGIPNDWVGFGAIKPESLIKIGSDTYIVSVMEALELKEMVNSDGFRNSVPKRPELKLKIKLLADSLDYDSDPILFLLKLRAK